MKKYLFLLLLPALILSACKKDHNCGCVQPPLQASSSKITSRSGGIAGVEVPLTEDQKNNILTINTDGTFTCINIVSRMIVSGTITVSNYNSIYGNRPRYVFTPKLPMLDDDYMILLDNTTGSMKFGDNNADGYMTIFTAQ